jgi:hypothetical protein
MTWTMNQADVDQFARTTTQFLPTNTPIHGSPGSIFSPGLARAILLGPGRGFDSMGRARPSLFFSPGWPIGVLGMAIIRFIFLCNLIRIDFRCNQTGPYTSIPSLLADLVAIFFDGVSAQDLVRRELVRTRSCMRVL